MWVRDDKVLSTNWQKKYNDTGMKYIQNRVVGGIEENEEDADQTLNDQVFREIEEADRDLYEEK